MKPKLILAVLALVVVLVVGAAAAVQRPRPDAVAAARSADRVFLIVGENTSAGQVTAADAPYLVGTLKPRAAWVTGYHSFPESKSLGQYIAMTSGQYTSCEAKNALPAGCHQRIANVFEQLQHRGRSWREWDESTAHPCDITDRGATDSKNGSEAHHHPAVYYTGIHGAVYDGAAAPKATCRRHVLPMGTTGPNDTRALDAALRSGKVGDLNLLVPNECENGHDPCGAEQRVSQFDDFLAREVPKIEASPAFGPRSTIIITWDEGDNPPQDPANPLLLAVGPRVRPGLVRSGAYTHYGLLRTIEDVFGLGHLARARTARALPIFGS